jgi:hypothetical protein
LLALLRSDLQQFYGPELIENGSVNAPLLAALGICAGLELLAKYWSGCADVPARTVRDFLTTIAGLSEVDAEIVLQFRNSLAHGYALGTRRRNDHKPFTFTLDIGGTSASPLISRPGTDHYVINLWSLKRLFQIAIGECKRAISGNQQRLGVFRYVYGISVKSLSYHSNRAAEQAAADVFWSLKRYTSARIESGVTVLTSA